MNPNSVAAKRRSPRYLLWRRNRSESH
jgi:hypothetical protein